MKKRNTFPQTVVENLLVACHRSCCLCHKFCGVKIELHHIMPVSEGGRNLADNAIALCFDCHAEVKSYNEKHPRGRKFSYSELRQHKERWLRQVELSPKVGNCQRTKSSLEQKKSLEIEMCWWYRPVAFGDIRKTITKCEREIVLIGMGLNTVADILCDPSIIRSIAFAKTTKPVFNLTIIMLMTTCNARTSENGGSSLKDQLYRGHDTIKKFYASLDQVVPENIHRPLVELKTYDNQTPPRHFFLKVDNTIYAGSYLSHQKGSHSYLMKLKKLKREGIYTLFETEISYLKEHSVATNREFFKAS